MCQVGRTQLQIYKMALNDVELTTHGNVVFEQKIPLKHYTDGGFQVQSRSVLS